MVLKFQLKMVLKFQLLKYQESYFMWLFGVMEADFLGAVDVDNCESILFMPRLPASYAVWMGESVVLFSRTLFSVYEFVDSNIK